MDSKYASLSALINLKEELAGRSAITPSRMVESRYGMASHTHAMRSQRRMAKLQTVFALLMQNDNMEKEFTFSGPRHYTARHCTWPSTDPVGRSEALKTKIVRQKIVQKTAFATILAGFVRPRMQQAMQCSVYLSKVDDSVFRNTRTIRTRISR